MAVTTAVASHFGCFTAWRLSLEIRGETDRSSGGCGRIHELADGFEDVDDRPIMRLELPLELLDLLRKFLLDASIWRSFTKARTTKTPISMARGELRTLAACIAPCSVNAYGRYL